MKRITQYLLIAGVVLGFAATELWAQAPAGSGNNGRANGRASFDPAQFQAQRLERYRQQLEVTGDAEWKVIGSRIEKVLTAQRDARVIGVARNRPGGGNPPAATDTSTAGNGRGNRGTRGNRGGASPSAEASPDVTDLQTALEAKASPEEIKAKLAKVRNHLKQAESTLAKAQEDLRSVLSVRQEALAVMGGLLR